MRHQFNFVRIEEVRAMLAEIENASTPADLSALYVRFVGYDIFEDDPTADFDDVQETLTDYIKEVAVSEGFKWSEIADVECR